MAIRTFCVLVCALAFPATASAVMVGVSHECGPDCRYGDPALQVAGEDGEATRVHIELSGNGYRIVSRVRAAWIYAWPAQCQVSGRSAICLNRGERRMSLLYARGADRDDVIEVDGEVDLQGYLFGGPGDDRLDGADESNTLFGGLGDDILRGGAGNADMISYSDRDEAVIASLGALPPSGQNGGPGETDVVGDDVENLRGSHGVGRSEPDVLVGDEGKNWLSASATSSVLYGRGGDDLLSGGFGDDLLSGDAGDDSFQVNSGDDVVSGGAGIDRLEWGGSAPAWNHLLSLDGERNDGQYVNDSGQSRDPRGLIGSDVEWVAGGDTADLVLGNAAANRLHGLGGNDIIDPAGGPDEVLGGPGDDYFRTIDGAVDVVTCGDGTDTVRRDPADSVSADCENVTEEDGQTPELAVNPLQPYYSPEYTPEELSDGPVSLDLEFSAANACEAGIPETKCLVGTVGGDKLKGTGRAEVLDGAAGSDRLTGGGKSDWLDGGAGNDTLDGGPGEDLLLGGPGRDRLISGPGAGLLAAGGGRDVIRADNGARDRIDCGDGRDTAVVDPRDKLRGCERIKRR